MRELNLESAVEFLGCLRSENLTAVYRRASCLLVPSACEGLPFVTLEALRAGLPAIVTDVVGHCEAISEGENGFLVPLDCPAAMASRAVELLEDQDLARSMRREARQSFVERFALGRMVDQYEGRYQKAIDSS